MVTKLCQRLAEEPKGGYWFFLRRYSCIFGWQLIEKQGKIWLPFRRC
jgi:hypothetical protein